MSPEKKSAPLLFLTSTLAILYHLVQVIFSIGPQTLWCDIFICYDFEFISQ